MNYVVSDLRGNLAGFQKLLAAIGFCERDTLYVLGDTVGEGENALPLLIDMSMRANVYPVAGERDLRALRLLSAFDEMEREKSAPDAAFIAEMTDFVKNGGAATLDAFRSADAEEREGILDYLSEFTLYEEASTQSGDFVLVHAGIDGFSSEKALDAYPPEAFFVPAACGARFFDDKKVVVGHLPTKSGKVEYEGGVIRLPAFEDGARLAALCLDDLREFYV